MIDEKLDEKEPEQIREYQLKKIKEVLQQSIRSRFYREFFSKQGIDVGSIASLDDFSRISQIDSRSLKERNLDMLTVSMHDVANIFSSGGTSGSPKIICYDKKSWLDYVSSVSRRWDYIGVTNRDVVGLMSNFDGLSLAGPTQQRSLEYKGIPCCCIGTSTPAEFATILIEKLGITFLNSLTPTLLTFTEKIEKMGKNPRKYNIKKLGTAGEPLTARKRQFLEEKWGAPVYDKYGATEVGMFAAECQEHDGMHLLENMLYFEVVVPGTNEPTEKKGELVVTSLINKAMPLIRYNLGDIVTIDRKECKCGYKSPRIYVYGRSEDTIYLQDAVKLTHEHFDDALSKFKDVGLDYQVMHYREDGIDYLKLRIELPKSKQTEKLRSNLSVAVTNSSLPYARGVQKGIYAKPEIEFVSPGSLPRTMRQKIKDKVIDNTGAR